MFSCFDLKFKFPCGLPTWRLIPDQFKWYIAAAANVVFVSSVIVDIVLYVKLLYPYWYASGSLFTRDNTITIKKLLFLYTPLANVFLLKMFLLTSDAQIPQANDFNL